jgi:integrase
MLQEEGLPMKGKVVPRGKCPKCNRPFAFGKKGYTCAEHEIKPERYRISIYSRYIYSDKQGDPLDSFSRAYKLLAHINTEIEDGTFDISKYVRSEQEQFLIGNLVPRFWDEKKDKLAPSWAPDFKRMMDRISAHLKNMDVRDLKRPHVIDFAATLKDYAPKTQKNHLDTLKEFLRWVRDDREMILRVPQIPMVEKEEKVNPWLSREDRDNLVTLTDEGDRPIIRFLATYGCRPGEARALRIRDVDLKRGEIHIHATFSDKEIRERRKGRGAPPLTLPIVPEVTEWLDKRCREALPMAPLFPNPRTGDFYQEGAIRRLKDRIWKKAGLDPSMRLYDATRHSVGSEMVSKGLPLNAVREMFGHTDVRTSKRYAHANLESKRLSLQVISGEKVVWIGLDKKTSENVK